MSGGRYIPRNWPKTWLNGSKLRKRTGCAKRSYFRYDLICSSRGAVFASTFPWVMTTPFGSAVVPEVKTISRASARGMFSGANAAGGWGANVFYKSSKSGGGKPRCPWLRGENITPPLTLLENPTPEYRPEP